MINFFLVLSLLASLSFIPARAAEPVQDFDIKEFDRKSDSFDKYICAFPTIDNRVKTIVLQNKLQKQTKIKEVMEHVKNTRPIMHVRELKLCDNFLAYKKDSGSDPERELYKSMTREQFINHLLRMRPMKFMGDVDAYLLRGIERKSGSGGFEAIGTNNESGNLVLRDYLSYDEMQISALIGIAGGTHFINDGHRRGQDGKRDPTGNHLEQGVYVGLVGARFERPGFNEWQHMVISSNHRKIDEGLARIWAKFYREKAIPTITPEQAQQDTTGRYIRFKLKDDNNDYFLDSVIYKKRLKLVIEPFLFDANYRGASDRKKVYLHIVGLGIGFWAVNKLEQERLMLEVYENLLTEQNFSNISDIDFTWFTVQQLGKYKDGDTVTTNDNTIKVHFSKREPAAKFGPDDGNKLLVAQYAWDGNAYVGNEYWDGLLAASGDPAAASCSTIPELQNPLINPYVSAKYLVTYGSEDDETEDVEPKTGTETAVVTLAASAKAFPAAIGSSSAMSTATLPQTTPPIEAPISEVSSVSTFVPPTTKQPLTSTLSPLPVVIKTATSEIYSKKTPAPKPVPTGIWGMLSSIRTSISTMFVSILSYFGSFLGWGR